MAGVQSKAPTAQPTMQQLLQTMQEGFLALKHDNLEPLQKSIDRMEKRLDDHAEQLEKSVEEPADFQTVADVEIRRLRDQQKVLLETLEDLDNRSRQQNGRIVGLPEGAEGLDAAAYVERMFQKLRGNEVFPRLPVVDRAHRVQVRQP
ncbi:hypothetical protein scyTo_0003703 [Scyliorhinus torazame]|uniref:Uncharacterized protein n=1 Tax=Scyliorhinus torazame TaxID=75743 RepID=A0A401PNA2_SCYTO|nr:hypothetical protein [Scyliorhinus torazame]